MADCSQTEKFRFLMLIYPPLSIHADSTNKMRILMLFFTCLLITDSTAKKAYDNT